MPSEELNGTVLMTLMGQEKVASLQNILEKENFDIIRIQLDSLDRSQMRLMVNAAIVGFSFPTEEVQLDLKGLHGRWQQICSYMNIDTRFQKEIWVIGSRTGDLSKRAYTTDINKVDISLILNQPIFYDSTFVKILKEKSYTGLGKRTKEDDSISDLDDSVYKPTDKQFNAGRQDQKIEELEAKKRSSIK